MTTPHAEARELDLPTLLDSLRWFAELCGDDRKRNKFRHATLAVILKAAHDRLATLPPQASSRRQAICTTCTQTIDVFESHDCPGLQPQDRSGDVRDLLRWFVTNGEYLKTEVSSAHDRRRHDASEWMREDDRDFRTALSKTLEQAEAALSRQVRPADIEALAEVVHKARFKDSQPTPWAEEDRSGREYCLRIARAVAKARACLTAAPAVRDQAFEEADEAVSSLLVSQDGYEFDSGVWTGINDALKAIRALKGTPPTK